ncbi:MAG: hypothetical protein ACLRRA_01255 [Acutalibacteraceae bacterium]
MCLLAVDELLPDSVEPLEEQPVNTTATSTLNPSAKDNNFSYSYPLFLNVLQVGFKNIWYVPIQPD